MNAIGCIYKIQCKKENKEYYGATTKEFKKRMKEHAAMLINDKHYNRSLQRAFNKWGASEFKGILMDIANTFKGLKFLEYMYIKESFKRNKNYNINISLNSAYHNKNNDFVRTTSKKYDIGDIFSFNVYQYDYFKDNYFSDVSSMFGDDTIIIESENEDTNIFDELLKERMN